MTKTNKQLHNEIARLNAAIARLEQQTKAEKVCFNDIWD